MKQFYLSKLLALVVILSGWYAIPAAAQCNCAYGYRVPITITNLGATALTNYQVSINMNTAGLVSAGSMQASGNDILFADGSCNNLWYWIQNGTMNTAATIIWIKVRSIPASGSTTIYMYYGDPTAASGANGDSTFVLFDDFLGSSLNAAKWNTVIGSGTVTVAGGNINISSSGSWALVESVLTYPAPYVSEISVISQSGSWPNLAQATAGYSTGASMFTNQSDMYLTNISGTGYGGNFTVTTPVSGISAGIWSFVWNSVNTIATWPGGSVTSTALTAATGAPLSAAFGGLDGGTSTMVIDWFRARQYYAAGTTQTVGAQVLNGGLTLGPITGSPVVCIAGTPTALGDIVPGGSWSSTNTAVAMVSSLTGAVTGVSSGTAYITYSIGACAPPVFTTVTVNPLPAPITGSASICTGVNDPLNDITPLGTWNSSNSAIAAIGSNSGIVSGLSQGVATLSYTLPTGCSATYSTTVSLSPVAYAVGGGGSYCAGTTAPNVTLSNSDFLISYQLWLNGTTLVSTLSGTGHALNFGPQATAGVYTIAAINTNGGCSLNMTGSAAVTINPNPAIYNLTPGGNTGYCAGGTGIAAPVGLSGSASGINYQLMLGTGAYGTPFTGTGSAFSFPGTETLPGVYTIQATNPVTGCSSAMSGVETVSLSPTPNIYAVSGGGSYCSGGLGVPVSVSNSDPGVSYSLSGGGASGTISGTGSMITFSNVTATGYSSVYSVIATNSSTGCTSTMSGTATININPLPEAYAVYAGGGGAYCAGGAGQDIILTYSVNGISYQLYNTMGAVGLPITGVDGALDFGAQTVSGPYTIVATNEVSHCINTMTGSAVITINPLPTPYNMSAGGAFCSGESGVDVNLTNSAAGTIYQLYNNGVFTGISDTSVSGGRIDFGLQTGGGFPRSAYSVLATNSVTGCMNNMTDTAVVTDNPLPTPYVVTGGGGYCVGATGKHIYLGGSDNGVNYQVYLGTGPIGSPMAGNGSGLEFGPDTGSGGYTILGTNAVTGCAGNMSGSATITINALPEVFDITGGGSYCAGGTGSPVGLGSSNPGTSYQLYFDGSPVGLPVSGISGPITFGPQTGAGVYTVLATNATTGCNAGMAGSENVAIIPSPTAYTVTGGGGYCSGGFGVPVGLSASNTGLTYQLYNGTILIGSPIAGTGDPIAFGNQAAPGSYMVTATNSAYGCTSNMTGSATVTLNPLPNIYSVSGGGGYCAGGSGVSVGLGPLSDLGVNYQLYKGSMAVGSPVAGTGSAIGFGMQTTPGAYSVIATNATTACTSNMSGVANVEIYPLPGGYTITGGGNFCAGLTGVPVGLDGSSAGINYVLSTGGGAVATLPGTGGPLSFGTETTPGTYIVSALNAATGCNAPMLGGATVVANPLPNIYNVTGGGSYCADSMAPGVGVSGSDAGVHYMLYNGTTLIGTYSAGTGSPVSFGPIASSGTYNVVAVNPSTSCTSDMTGTATVSRMPLVTPMVTVSPSATTVCSGTAVTFTAAPSNGGSTPSYQWYVFGTPAGTGASTYTYDPTNGDMVSVMLTSSANCASGAASSTPVTMTVNATVSTSVTTGTVGDSVCQGTTAFFYAVPVNGGLTPIYSWYKNTVEVQSGPDLTYSVLPASGDQVYVTMQSSVPCPSNVSSTGNTITMYVQEPMTPVVTLAVSPGTTIKSGATVTFTATAANTTIPVYSWEINGNVVSGATGHIFSANNFSDGDVVTSIVTNEDICGMNPGSAFATIHVLPEGVQQVTAAGGEISVLPNPSKGDFVITGAMGTSDDVALTIEITNVLGQVIYNNKAMAPGGKINEHIQLNNSLANGTYMLSIRSEAENAVFHIVVEK